MGFQSNRHSDDYADELEDLRTIGLVLPVANSVYTLSVTYVYLHPWLYKGQIEF
jgi:hypothetical protein